MRSAFATFGCSHNSCAGELPRSASSHFVYFTATVFWNTPSKVEVSCGVKKRGDAAEDEDGEEPAQLPQVLPLLNLPPPQLSHLDIITFTFKPFLEDMISIELMICLAHGPAWVMPLSFFVSLAAILLSHHWTLVHKSKFIAAWMCGICFQHTTWITTDMFVLLSRFKLYCWRPCCSSCSIPRVIFLLMETFYWKGVLGICFGQKRPLE